MTGLFSVEKEVEFDTAHRVPNHKSKCRNLHGHRYRVIVSVRGQLVADSGQSDQGMVMDFGDIKSALTNEIHDVLDHGTIYYVNDESMEKALQVFRDSVDVKYLLEGAQAGQPRIWRAENRFDWNVWTANFVPTAENLAWWAHEVLSEKIDLKIPYGNELDLNPAYDRWARKVAYVRVFETPTSVAQYPGV